jgi:enolase
MGNSPSSPAAVIVGVHAREVYDSRGNPTVEVLFILAIPTIVVHKVAPAFFFTTGFK